VRGTKKNPYFILIIFRRLGRCRFRVIFLLGEIKFSQGLSLRPPHTQISVNQFWSLSSDKNKPQSANKNPTQNPTTEVSFCNGKNY